VSYSRPGNYPYPNQFKSVEDAEAWAKKLYASLQENDRAGDVIKIYGQVLDADLKVDYATGDLDSESEVIATVNATNTKINDLITAMQNTGLLAAS